MSSRVVLYSKPRCGLCDKARSTLQGAGIVFDEVDITEDPGLQQEYSLLIPVIEVAGNIVFEAGMKTEDLPKLLEESRSG